MSSDAEVKKLLADEAAPPPGLDEFDIDGLPIGDADGPTKLNQLPIRWLMLALQCLALMGSYYCYDNPTAVENQVCLHMYLHK